MSSLRHYPHHSQTISKSTYVSAKFNSKESFLRSSIYVRANRLPSKLVPVGTFSPGVYLAKTYSFPLHVLKNPSKTSPTSPPKSTEVHSKFFFTHVPSQINIRQRKITRNFSTLKTIPSNAI